MGAESDAVCGAGYGERGDERTNTRDGYRRREWDTRAGSISLAIPKGQLPDGRSPRQDCGACSGGTGRYPERCGFARTGCATPTGPNWPLPGWTCWRGGN
jgi:Transposase, Mutator family